MAKILVVDDSKVDRLLIGGMLGKEQDFEVSYAEDGADALTQLENLEADLVVADIFMPNLDGFELAERMRDSHPRTPLLIVTSHGSEEVAVRALRAGAASYVPKSVLATELIDAVETVLESARDVQSRFEVMQSLVTSGFHWKLGNDRALFGPLISFLQESLAGLSFCDENDRTRIGVALEEALVNAAEHGNLELDSQLRREDRREYLRILRERLQEAPFTERFVDFRVDLSENEARFVIRDEGSGFDPHDLPDPTDPENLLKASGRGVMLMRTFMDEVTYNDVGNEVTMVKRSLTP